MMPCTKRHLWCDNNLVRRIYADVMKIRTDGAEAIYQYRLKIRFPKRVPVLRGYSFSSVCGATYQRHLVQVITAVLLLFYVREELRTGLLEAIVARIREQQRALRERERLLLLAAVQVSFRDIGLALPLVLQVWMFASPVVYPLSAVPEAYKNWYVLNPMVGVIENFRRTILQGLPPDWHSLGTTVAVTAVLFPAAYAYFKHREATMADVI